MGWKVDVGHFPQCLDGKGWWIHDDTLRTTKKHPKTMWTSWRPKTSTASGDDLEASLVLIGIVPFFRVCFVIVFFLLKTGNCQLHLWCFFPFCFAPVSHGFTPTETNEFSNHLCVIARHSEVHGELEAKRRYRLWFMMAPYRLNLWSFCFRKKATAAMHLYLHMLLAVSLLFYIYIYMVEFW